MNAIQNFFPSSWIEATGWTIIHSLWQATLILALLALLLRMLRTRSAQIKYFIAYVSLIGMVIWSIITFVQAYQYANEKQLLKTQILKDPTFVKELLKSESNGVAANQVNLNIVKTKVRIQRHFNTIWMIWLAGLVIFTIRLLGGYLYTQRLRRFQISPLPDEWLLILHDLMMKLNLSKPVSAFFSPLTCMPITLGVMKPVILFPVTALTGLSLKEAEAVIAHELAHIMRHDYLLNIIQSIIEIVFFYHPAIWMISRQIKSERENCCDNIAISVTGDKIAFAKALAAVQNHHHEVYPQLSMAFSTKGNHILQRIKRIQKQPTMKTNFKEQIIAACIIIGGLTLASFTIGLQLPPNVSLNDKSSTPVVLSKEKRDSICSKFEAKINSMEPNHEDALQMKKVVEITYSETDSLQLSEIAAEIEKAMKEIDFENLMKQTMQEVSAAMKLASESVRTAQTEIDHEELRRDMEEARKDIEEARREMAEDMRRDMKADGIDDKTIEAAIEAASAGMDVAEAVVANLDIEKIIEGALQSVSGTLGALGDLADDSTLTQPDAKKELRIRMEQLEKEKKKIEEEQKQLKAQLKEMEN